MRSQSAGKAMTPYIYLSPAVFTILVLSVFPLLFTIYLAFTDASLYTFQKGISFIGIENFIEMFQGSFATVFFPVLGWTFGFALLACTTQYALGMFLAVLLNNPNMRESNLYRAILIIPWAIPGTLAILAWTGLFNTSTGTINLALGKLLGLAPLPWLQDPTLARAAVLIVSLWLGFPWFMTVCLGALQSIPYEIYEAADIDGASAWHKFWKVTFPMLLRFSLPLLIGSFAMNFNNFGAVFLMTGGGPIRVGSFQAGYTDLLVSVGYKLTLNLNRYGLSAALSCVLFILVVAISLFNMKATGAFRDEEA